MKSKQEILSMLFAILAELQTNTANEKVTGMLQTQLKLLYDILGEEVPEEYWQQIEKELNKFWATAKRLDNKSVDWESMTQNELDYFEYIYKKSESIQRKLSKLEDNGINGHETMKLFMELNNHSISF